MLSSPHPRPLRQIRVADLNAWLRELDSLAQLYGTPVDLADIAWIGRYQRNMTPAQALHDFNPSTLQLQLFACQ